MGSLAGLGNKSLKLYTVYKNSDILTLSFMDTKQFLKEIKKYSWLISIIFSIAAFGFSAYNLKLTNQRLSSISNYSSSGTQVAGSSVDIKKFEAELTGQEPFLGDKNAKVTIYEFADFQCPFCKRFFDQTFSQLKSKYIDTGKAKLVFIDLAILGQESTDAAEAAKCAGDQEQFWAYHDMLYQNQNGENLGTFNSKQLANFAEKLHLNLDGFNKCVTGHKYAEKVNAEQNLARKYGLGATPSFIINGKIVKGTQPISFFDQFFKN